MRPRVLLRYLLLLSALALTLPLWSQWPSHQSVLAEYTWYKIGVTADGVYRLDYATLYKNGIDVRQLDPARIRLYGNVQGALPESNNASRYDDLTEVAIEVTGGDDGSFDEDDALLFYGQGPVKLTWITSGRYYQYERNPYTDTIYYFLCIDAPDEGLRIEEREALLPETAEKTVTDFPDCYYHESEELSPYSSGRVWFGDLFTRLEGYKEFPMTIPGLQNTRGVRIETKVMGRCKPSASFRLMLNNTVLAANQPLDKFNDHEYGKMYTLIRTAYPDSEDLVLRYQFEPGEGNPMLFIDYHVLSFWRTLQYRGEGMPFRIVPSQLSLGDSEVVIANADSMTVCWNVTDPLRPVRQHTVSQDGGVAFGVNGKTEQHYQLFGPSDVKPVSSFRAIPNQNLHALTDAEMLIISPHVFMAQAQALASFHEERDSLDCVVVDIAEIYNEFSTGSVDPTALRDMIRMVYLRSRHHLKYVLLLGKGTHDYRNLKGIDNNFVPPYENVSNPCSEVSSMCTDDYYALMDSDEGDNCDGKVDLGVGRIPIITPEQGDAVMEKIRHYVDLDATHGAWKNNHLLLADNDSKVYPTYAEALSNIIEANYPAMTTKKLYLDAYPVVSTPTGDRVPLAHEALMDYFDKGILTLSYTGHGGLKNLSGEWVLAPSDILALKNYDRLPFIHTATCEFSKFDRPDAYSGGELLLLNAHGGAIALLTTVRPTQAQTNQFFSRSLSTHLFEKKDGQTLRFGDLYRIVKSDPAFYKKGNIVYVLMGDPALRLSYPTHQVVTDEISGAEFITVKGHILNPEGILDTLFNGVLDVRLYDRKSQYATLGQHDVPVNYAYYNDVLFDGKASVTEGRFELVIPLPSAVSQGTAKTRLSYYAYDTLRKVDANGVYDGYELSVPPEAVDHQGPDIKLYWDTPEFRNGDIVSPSGTLYADLFDEHGIYHYNVSIGRDIVMRSSIDTFDNRIMNDRYEPVLDDYRRGRIVIPMSELPDGSYEFTLKAWDTWNNSTEVEMLMVVERNTLLAQVKSFPNPFDGEVFFSFVNGEVTEDLDVQLEVFDLMGRRVALVSEHTASMGGEVPMIRWDGRGDSGYSLSPGVYVYRLIITNSEGKTRTLTHRLIKK